MYTRTLNCKLKLEKKDAFIEAARQLAGAYKDQSGFVDLLTFISDENPNHAIVAAVWKTKAEAAEFYKNHAPLLDLKPFLEEHHIEHYHLESPGVFGLASGKAA